MKKTIKLTESDLVKIVKKITNESHDRITNSEMINNRKYESLVLEGFKPYYLDLTSDGDYKITEFKVSKEGKHYKGKIYFLDKREYGQLNKLLESTNKIISEHKEMINLYRKQLIGVLEQKIIK
jgi:hypothetical protein